MKFKSIKVFIIIVLVIGMLLPIYSLGTNEVNVTTEQEKVKEDVFEKITAPNLILANTDTGRILYERNADEKIYPASVTKLMTAIIVVEECKLSDIATVSEKAVKSVPFGYVNANLKIGEKLTIENLLNAMLIPSANDAANVLAEHVGGTIDNFAEKMNSKAKELGCTGTNFTNPSGLHEENHYTTTKDLLLIAREAIQKNTIRTIIGKTTYTLPKSNKYNKSNRILTTTNYMKRKELTRYYYQYCIGAKTGYTGEAKNCVIEYASKNNINLVAIVMGENAKIKGTKFLDAKQMFEYGFSKYKNKQIAKKNQIFETITIPNGTKETRNLETIYKSDINIIVNKDKNVTVIDWKNNENNSNNDEYIIKKIEYSKTKAPIQKGEIIGKVTYKYDGIEYSSNIIANGNVEESKILQLIVLVSAVVLIILIIYFMIKSKRKRRKNKKRYVEFS